MATPGGFIYYYSPPNKYGHTNHTILDNSNPPNERVSEYRLRISA